MWNPGNDYKTCCVDRMLSHEKALFVAGKMRLREDRSSMHAIHSLQSPANCCKLGYELMRAHKVSALRVAACTISPQESAMHIVCCTGINHPVTLVSLHENLLSMLLVVQPQYKL